MALAIMLAGESFAADGADKGSLVCVGTQVRAEVIGACESFRAKVALEGGWMFLALLFPASAGCGSFRVCQVEQVLARVGGGTGAAIAASGRRRSRGR